MRFTKTLFSLLALTFILTGCAVGPTNNIASPDVPNYRYQVVEGESVKMVKPEPGTMGLLKTGGPGRAYEVVDFQRFSFNSNSQIPDNHMIGVQVYDPDAENGRLIIPLQYISRLDGGYGRQNAYHTIDGLKSPLKIDLMDGQKEERFMIREYSEDGAFVDFVHEVQVNTNPKQKGAELNRGHLANMLPATSSGSMEWTFFIGEDFEKEWAKANEKYEEDLEESARMRKRAFAAVERQNQDVKRALNAEKSVGQQVCSTDKYIGIVEQVAHGRVKMNVIGRVINNVTSDFLYYKDVPARLDIDLRDEGKMIWRKSGKVGVCNIDIVR